MLKNLIVRSVTNHSVQSYIPQTYKKSINVSLRNKTQLRKLSFIVRTPGMF